MLPGEAQVVKPPRNLGFAAGANLGSRVGAAPHVLFLNPDLELRPRTLAALLGHLSAAADVAAAGPALRRAGWRLLHCPDATCVHTFLLADPEHRAPATMWLHGLDRYYRLPLPHRRRLLHPVMAAGLLWRSLGRLLVGPAWQASRVGAASLLAGSTWCCLSLGMRR